MQVILTPPDGGSMQAYASLPDRHGKGPFPGLVVFPEAFGVNHHMKAVADRFAAAGFVAVCPELYHRSAPAGWTCGYDQFDQARGHMKHVTLATLQADAKACWDWLRGQAQVDGDRIACVGYCLGGRAAFAANLALPFKAAISYYGGGIVPDLLEQAAALHGPMLFFWGGLDDHIGPAAPGKTAEALRAAKKPCVNVEVSYAGHGFACDERPSFHPQAANEAWALTQAFLREKLA